MEAGPLVSVCMITYNHVSFIQDAIEGVLAQRVNFEMEYIIADDYSTDGTREILLEYQEKHPGLIRLILQTKNTGAANNWADLIRSPRGKYISYFEGDDYWTNSEKLQKQVDFLESNPDFAICFHNARIIFEESSEQPALSNPAYQKEISTFEDLAKGEYIYTSTCMFRRIHLKKYPEKYLHHLNNYTLDLHNAQYGSIKYISEVMSVYRKHSGGIWSMVAREKTLMAQLPTYKFYLDYFPKRHRHFFVEHLRNIFNELIEINLAKKNHRNFWRFFSSYCLYNAKGKGDIKRIFYTFLRGGTSSVRQIIKND